MTSKHRIDIVPIIVIILFFGLMTFVEIGTSAQEDKNRQACESKGGVWFYRENLCLKGERIPIGE